MNERDYLRDPRGTKTGGQFTTVIGDEEPIDTKDYEEKGDLSAKELKELREEALNWRNLLDEEINILQQYTNELYADVNGALRSGDIDADTASIADVLNGAIEKSLLPQNTILFRGVSGPFADQMGTLKPGDAIIDPGFTSTTLDAKVARNITARHDGRAVVMRIYADQGARALIPAQDSHYFADEDEVLLPRGTRLRFLRRTAATYDFHLAA